MNDTETPIERFIRSKGGDVHDETSAQLGIVRTFLQAALKQYKSLDEKSQDLLEKMFIDFALSELGSEYIKKAVSLYLEEAELEEAEEFAAVLAASPPINKE